MPQDTARPDNPTSAPTASSADLSNCEREPIHIPGSIQPHGLLCILAEPSLAIASISANVTALTGKPAAAYAAQPLDALLDAESAALLRDGLARSDPDRGNPFLLRLRDQSDQAAWNGIFHRHAGLAFLELEPRHDGDASYRDCFDHVRVLTRRLNASRTLLDACRITVAEVRRITGFRQVIVYRFLPDASGHVIGEDRDESMPSYVGLHFPASDIPAQARALYLRNPSRNIPNARYTPAPLDPPFHPVSGKPIDLSYAVLRSVSPVHLEYLKNMGAQASMSVSILRDGRLWGLISCMDRVPRHTGYETRQACELMAQALAWQVGVLEEVESVRHGLRVKTLHTQLIREMQAEPDAYEVLRRNHSALLEAVSADGAAMYISGALTPVGQTPPGALISRIITWLTASHRGDVFHTEQLSAELPEAAAHIDTASGLLAVPLSPSGSDMILWFRPELPRTVAWGGDPHKSVQADGPDRLLHPRKSFAAWTEQVRARGKPWERFEIAAAMEFRDLAVDAIVRRSEQLERANAAIERAASKLQTFVQIASHDLLEPARQVETLTDILEAVVPVQDGDVSEVLEGIRGVSGRLRRLIGDLADYARVGRDAEPFEPADLDALLQEAQALLAPKIAAARARIIAESLPTVVCDHRQILHVLLNLLSNAVKYRSPDRECVIRVYAEPDAAQAGGGPSARRMVNICVADNGIGFDGQYAAAIFEPFRRLHTSNEYEGSGVGLAICHKIIERHGGSIRATGQPGNGAVFSFTLPTRGTYPANA